MPIRVLVVDDSALMRQLLTECLSADPQIQVVGSAPDPFIARDKIKQLRPDVVTLDVEMPRMDGLTFLENLMRLHPMPVVMVSSLTAAGAEATLHALELGAVDFVTKPSLDVQSGVLAYADELKQKVKAAAKARVRGSSQARPAAALAKPAHMLRTTDRLIAIGASTGGTEAIKEVLIRMPADSPAIVITQHIPPAFSGPFARRMNENSAMSVCEAEDGQKIVPGHVYIAPGGRHLEVARDGIRWRCKLTDAEPVNRHKPSVDVLFVSVARNVGRNAVGVVLTGMGDDGARGLLEMKNAGAPTIVQDEATSVVWGMPGAAFKLGAADHVKALPDIADLALTLAAGEGAPTRSSAAVAGR
ncbi:MAG TPA: chemotaxis response regulator protein-glutamate methylesterase [Nevskiaceae bacterium]|nr:chemotaxis response regulator protein-glutamate methylesterase [Nevskiaceae bacterium]